jgi:hypothetical protein
MECSDLQEGAALRDHTSLVHTYQLFQGQGELRGCAGSRQEDGDNTTRQLRFHKDPLQEEATTVASITSY